MSYPDIKVGVPSILLCIEMAIFAALHIIAFPYRPYSLAGKNALTVAGAGYSGQAHYKGGPFGVYAYMEAFNPWDIIKASARGFRWLFVGVRYRNADGAYEQAAGGGGIDRYGGGHLHPNAATRGGFGGYQARSPSSSEGNASSIYSSTKLGPVGKDGPTPLQRERHMSAEYVASAREREHLKQLERQRGHEYGGVGQSGSGDLGDVGLPRSDHQHAGDTGYHGAQPKQAYYGDELPPAPVPLAMPRTPFEDDSYDRLSPWNSHGELEGSPGISRDVSPAGSHGHRRGKSTEEDRAALLADQSGGRGRGYVGDAGGLHPGYRRG